MANKLYNESDIQAIANAIRAKGGTSSTMTVSQMATAIGNIPTGAPYSFEFDDNTDTIQVGSSATETISVTPEILGEYIVNNITITSNNNNVTIGTPSYTGDGSIWFSVTGVSAGTSTITATTPNGATDTMTITVEGQPSPSYTIAFSRDEEFISGTGGGSTSHIKVTPSSYAEDIYENLVFTVNNNNVSIDMVELEPNPQLWRGEIRFDITAEEIGTSIVTVTAPNGSTDTLTVYVEEEEPYEFYFDPDDYTVNVNETNTVVLTLTTVMTIDLDQYANELTVTTSDDVTSAILSVEIDEIDTSIAHVTVGIDMEGEYTITATIDSIGVEATATVTGYSE